MRYVVWLLLLLSPLANAGLFGYYHVHNQHVSRIVDHTNMLVIQTANPDQNLDHLLAAHPTAPFILEFSAYDLALWPPSKRMIYNAGRTEAILDALEEILPKYMHRLAGFSIFDEKETNLESIETIQKIARDIRARPLFASVPLSGNYDNIYPWYSGAQFYVIDELDYVSLTPSYGQLCSTRSRQGWRAIFTTEVCEKDRYAYFLDAVAERNRRTPGRPAKLIVIGDNWFHHAGMEHVWEPKARMLYETAKAMAEQRSIQVAGQLVFSYSAPGEGTVSNSPAMKETWRVIGRDFLNVDLSPQCK